LSEDGAVELLRVHYINPVAQGGADQRSNMLVVTPNLLALIQSDPEAVIDLVKGELSLPRFRKRLKIAVSAQHSG
jgi:hypothetical protein